MSNKLTLGKLFKGGSQPAEVVRIVIILTLGEIGRWLYGGGRLRERVGDLIICLLIFYLIRHHIINLPPLLGAKLSSGAIAICIALIGTHGISQILIYIFKKRTGLDLSNFFKK